MNKSSFAIILMLLGVSVPVWCLAAQDAIPGMATQGIVRLPHPGMVEQTFDATRRPNVRLYRKPYENSSRIDAQSQSPSSVPDRQDIEGRIDSKGQVNLFDLHSNQERLD